MNFDRCANCQLHSWKQVEDLATLQKCKRCKLIKYCGRDCQTEHWLKVHHKHCKYFANAAKARLWDHKDEDCTICRQAALVGRIQLMRPDNPNYECIFEEMKKVPPQMIHPHPFPSAGEPGDVQERSILVLWQLLNKFELTQPGVVANCRDEFKKGFFELARARLKMWIARKISPHPQTYNMIHIDVSSIGKKFQTSESIPDPFQLWKIIELVERIVLEVAISQKVNDLVNPLADIPTEFHAIVSQGISNSVQFLSTANEILDALATRIIPYREVLSIICGGSLEKTCSFCSKRIIIAELSIGGSIKQPFAIFGLAHTTMFCCLSNSSCNQKANKSREVINRSGTAMMAAAGERCYSRCDFCFKSPPIADMHRCSKCLSVMYCSTACRDQDFEIHKEVCKEDVEERKKKCGRSARRKGGKDSLENIEKGLEADGIQEVTEVLGKFNLKNSKKKSNK